MDSFQELLDEYETETETNSKLKKMVDNVSYILAKYGKTFQLLPQLNLLRKVFSSKTAATPVGKLYVSFRKRIYNANLAIEQEKRLLKKIVTNAKIIDAREMGEEIFAPTGPIDYEDNEILYDKWYCHAEAIKTVNVPENADDYNTSIYGIFFFDYEKIVNSCYVTNIFDIDKLVTWFGRELIQAFLYPTSATVTSYTAPDEDSDYDDYGASKNLSIIATNDDTPKTVYNKILQYESSQHIDSFVDANDNTRYSYLQLRNFTPVVPSTTWNDYRLMCFEYRELIEGDITGHPHYLVDILPYYRYVAEVTVKDSTVDIARLLWKIVSRYYKLLDAYLNEAQERCAFNDIDGKYNQFFIDAMEEKYADTPETAPWNIAPIVYNVLRDIGFDTFKGNYADLIAASLEISTKISPFTGVIWELEAFVGKFDELLNDTFGSDTDTDSSSPGYWIWLDDETELGVSYEETTYTNELSIDDIPAVVYGIDVDDEDDDEDEGDYELVNKFKVTGFNVGEWSGDIDAEVLAGFEDDFGWLITPDSSASWYNNTSSNKYKQWAEDIVLYDAELENKLQVLVDYPSDSTADIVSASESLSGTKCYQRTITLTRGGRNRTDKDEKYIAESYWTSDQCKALNDNCGYLHVYKYIWKESDI